jgi:hypothetical protein
MTQRPCSVRKSLFTPLGRIRERHHLDDLGAQCERHRMPKAFESAGLPQVACGTARDEVGARCNDR